MLLSFLSFFFFLNYLILAVLDLVPVWVFPWLQSVGAHSSCAARSSHCHGFSCWGARALGSTGLSSCDTGLVAPRHVGSSWTRDRTGVACIFRRVLYS